MKRLLIALCLLCLLLTGCSPAYEKLTEPVADDPDQKFNTVGQYLPIILNTLNGNTCEAAVKLEVSTDFENRDAFLKELEENPDACDAISQSPEWKMEQMRLLQARVLVMPLGDADFENDFPYFTIAFGMYHNDNLLGGGVTGSEEDLEQPGKPFYTNDKPLHFASLLRKQSAGMTAEPGDELPPFAFYYSPPVLIEAQKPYYEVMIYALIPKEEYVPQGEGYMVGFTDGNVKTSFVDMTFDDIPTKGKYVWLL